MKTVTYEKLIALKPYLLNTKEKAEQLKSYFESKPNMNAMDILALDKISINDRLWAVLREELIPVNTLHEFACLCAERVLARVTHPDPRYAEAVAAKRKWMKGEISDATYALAWDAARVVARLVASSTFDGTVYDVFEVINSAAYDVAVDEECKWQLDTLIKLLRGKQPNEKAIKVCCKTCKNNVEEPPPHTCDYCDALDTPDYFMWEMK